MTSEALCALGAVSVAALLASGVYLWHQLIDVSVPHRLANMIMPASQIALVACVYALKPYFAHWEMIALVVAPMGIVGALLNPLFFKGLLDAERAGAEAERVAFLEDQLATQGQYAVLAQQNWEESANVRAKLDNQLALIEEAIAAGDVQRARMQIADADQVMCPPKDRCCQHPVVDALLCAKAAWCEKEGISIDIDATVPENLSTPDVELCALFANALDNAVHACLEMPEDGRWVRVEAYPAHGYFLLEVENSCAVLDGVKTGKKGPRLAKGGFSRHGHGLSIMRGIVERHDGELVCKHEGAVFLLSAIWRL